MHKNLSKLFSAVTIAVGTAFAAGSAFAGPVVYATSTDASGSFIAYDIAGGAWSTKASIQTRLQITADRNGDVFAHDTTTNQIKRYDATANAWVVVANGPSGFGSSNGVLAMLNDGRIAIAQASTSNLHVYSAGVWTTHSLGFTANRVGDYDPELNQFVLGQQNSSNGHLIDLNTFANTALTGGGGNGEWARLGEVANGRYYFQDGNGLWSWDLSNPGAGATSLGGGEFYPSGAIDRASDLLYIVDLGGGSSFSSYNLNTQVRTNLAGLPSGMGFHSTAVVGGVSFNSNNNNVPEPASFGLAGLALLGLLASRRKA